jgi:hypothetical protein
MTAEKLQLTLHASGLKNVAGAFKVRHQVLCWRDNLFCMGFLNTVHSFAKLYYYYSILIHIIASKLYLYRGHLIHSPL